MSVPNQLFFFPENIFIKNHNFQIFRFIKRSTETNNKQHGEQDSKGNRYENTCIFPNGECNQTMDKGEYLELWDQNQRSPYD